MELRFDSSSSILQLHLVEGACDDSSPELYNSESAGTKVSLPEDELDVTFSRASKYSTLGSRDGLLNSSMYKKATFPTQIISSKQNQSLGKTQH